MNEVNLLPAEKKPKASVLKLSKTLRKVLSVAAVVFFSITVVFVAAYLFFSNKIKEAKGRHEDTKRQILALEQTEQRYFLLQDRLKKIETIKGTKSAKEEIGIFKDVLGYMEEGMVFSKAELNNQDVVITFYIKNSHDLASFIENLKSKGGFKSATLSSLAFNPNYGYETVFVLGR